MIHTSKTRERPLWAVRQKQRANSFALKRRVLRTTAALLTAAISALSLLPAAASAAPAGLKVQPVAPMSDTPGVAAPEADKNNVPKTVTTLSWQISLSASKTSLWPTEYTT